MVEINECIQAYNSSGEIVYRFRNVAELDEYNDKYWAMNPECYAKLNSADGRFARANDLLFYKEDQVIKTNYALIDSIIGDCTYVLGSIKFTGADRHNINRYGSQYTMDILQQILDIIQPKVHQPDWEKQAFAIGAKPFFTIPVDDRSILDKLKDQVIQKKLESMEKGLEQKDAKRKDALGGEDGGNYDASGNSAHYKQQFMEFIRAQERKFGTIAAYITCISNIDKYEGRAGEKEGVPFEKDFVKKSWYKKAANHFKKKIEGYQQGFRNLPGRNTYVEMPEEILDLLKVELPQLHSIPDYVPLSEAIEK